MNLIQIQKKLCLLEEISMKMKNKKMNDHGKDSYNYAVI